MCKVLNVSKSGYYKWFNGVPCKRALENKQLTEQIRLIHAQSKQSYGSPRICKQLQSQGGRVSRLMKQAHLRSKTLQGWLYLTVILDLACQKVLGWALSKSLDASSTSMAAWKMAVSKQPPQPGMIFHSDQGVQYACSPFRQRLEQHPLRQSMSRKANCWDNAVAESFFKSLKVEWIYDQHFVNTQQAELAVFEYIEAWYNTRRRHSALGYRTPMEFEQFLFHHTAAA